MAFSVEINGVYVPVSAAPRRISQFSRALTFHNEGSQYELSILGSCGLLRFSGSFFLVASQHQLGKGETQRQMNEVCIAFSDRNGEVVFGTAGEASTVKFSDDDYLLAGDIVILRFKEEDYSTFDLKKFFISVGQLSEIEDVNLDDIDFIFCTGYPSEQVGYDFNDEDPENITVEQIRSKFCTLFLAHQGLSEIPSHVKLTIKMEYSPYHGSLDGFSGAPVFFIHKDFHNNRRLGFLGMVTRGSNSIMHVLGAAQIKDILRRTLQA